MRPEARSTSSTSYCMGTFYLSDWENSGDTLADFTAVDAVACWTAHPMTARL